MKTTEKGIALIKKHEGCRLEAYRCPAGVLTIGYGHTGDVRPGQRITEAEADSLLRKDIEERERQIDALLAADLAPNQYDAVVSFVFNLGIGNFAGSTLLKKINADPSDRSIAYEFGRWVRAGGKLVSGLVRRREDEVTLYFSK